MWIQCFNDRFHPQVPLSPRRTAATPPSSLAPVGISISPFTALGVPEGPQPPRETCARARARRRASEALAGERASRSMDAGSGEMSGARQASALAGAGRAFASLPAAPAGAAAGRARAASHEGFSRSQAAASAAAGVFAGMAGPSAPQSAPGKAGAAAAAVLVGAPGGGQVQRTPAHPPAAASAAAAAAAAFGMPASGRRRSGGPPQSSPGFRLGLQTPAGRPAASAAAAAAAGKLCVGTAREGVYPGERRGAAPAQMAAPSHKADVADEVAMLAATTQPPLVALQSAKPRAVPATSLAMPMAAPNLAAVIAAHSLLAAPAAPLSAVLGSAALGIGFTGARPALSPPSGSLLSTALARLSLAPARPSMEPASAPAGVSPPRGSSAPSPGSPGTPPAVEPPTGRVELADAAGAFIHEVAHPAANPTLPRLHEAGLVALLPARTGAGMEGIYPAPLPRTGLTDPVDDMHDTYGAHMRLGGASPPSPGLQPGLVPRQLVGPLTLRRLSSDSALGLAAGAPVEATAPPRRSFGSGGAGGRPPKSPRFASQAVPPAFEVLQSLPEGAADPNPNPGTDPDPAPSEAAAADAAALGERRASYLAKTLRYLAHARLQDAAAVACEGAVPDAKADAARASAEFASPRAAAAAAAEASYAERAGEGAITRAKRVLAEAAMACPVRAPRLAVCSGLLYKSVL